MEQLGILAPRLTLAFTSQLYCIPRLAVTGLSLDPSALPGKACYVKLDVSNVGKTVQLKSLCSIFLVMCNVYPSNGECKRKAVLLPTPPPRMAPYLHDRC